MFTDEHLQKATLLKSEIVNLKNQLKYWRNAIFKRNEKFYLTFKNGVCDTNEWVGIEEQEFLTLRALRIYALKEKLHVKEAEFAAIGQPLPPAQTN